MRELSNEMNIAVDSKLVSDATGRNAITKLATTLTKIVSALGERSTPAALTTRDSATPDVDADTPIESTEIQEEEESLAKETSELSIADSVDSADLQEPSYNEDDEDALANQLQLETEKSMMQEMDDSVMDDSAMTMDESREASVLSIRTKSKSVSRQPTRMSKRSERAVSESDSGEETL